MMPINIVELIAMDDGADCAYDQPCKFGHRVEFHAVYCHNREWNDAPRKCKRGKSGYGTDKPGRRERDCPGFELNPKADET